ncbi:uncharacterized protein SAPINGB_P000434 [Magnusiomyces paraingens]|uniref:Fe2OG dioxygenase domain-containing protein n=1 Tax=Magnusiomyces paraingens TaxID=2606893 RepID=A0A5E8B6N7_9ASCO|nr:uncharacterized protein SAPINGB_P000434 [Saprochaete ingens]VVT44491.1 unnamed protein product [Saprochaete ingens]
MTNSLALSPEQIATFQKEGCLVIPNELPLETVTKLLDETANLLNTFSLEDHPLTQFTTGEGTEERPHVGDDYFLESGDKVRYFFEEGAFETDPKTGKQVLVKPKERAINKIGHYLHASPEVSPTFGEVTVNERNHAIVDSLGYDDARVLQSMVICKQPTIGGEVPPHQDATFLYTKPLSCLGFWYALEDCTKENGALQYLPGSHLNTPIAKRLVRTGESGEIKTTFEPVPGAVISEEQLELQKDASKYKWVECPAGSLVLIHNSVVHKSEHNLSNKSRYAYAFHVIEGTADYDTRNWLQIPSTGGANFTKL